MDHKRFFTAEKIRSRLALIAPLQYAKAEPIAPFHLKLLDGPETPPPLDEDYDGGYDGGYGDWPVIPFGSFWGAPNRSFLLRTRFSAKGPHQALYLPLGNSGDIFTHPEGLLYIDGVSLASADRHHHLIDIPEHYCDGQLHELALHGWTGWAGWPLDLNAPLALKMGRCGVIKRQPRLEAFVQRARVLLETVEVLAQNPALEAELLTALHEAFLILDTRVPGDAAFFASLPAALARLEAIEGDPLPVRLQAIGHAHMDLAYLWTIPQTRLKNTRTYSNVLRLMDKFPAYHFSHSQPQLYAYTKEDRPDLYQAIQQRVAEGRWEIMGGMWVEADLNIPSGESLVRQILYGRRFFEREFEAPETPVLWLPDSFGFPASIPQLMVQAGLTHFVTNKLNWNQTNRLPDSSFIWEGLDGSRVGAQLLTTPRPVQYLPFPTSYKSELSAKEVMGTWTHSQSKAELRHLPLCYGYGDGGGGPSEALIARAVTFAAVPGMPQVEMGRLST